MLAEVYSLSVQLDDLRKDQRFKVVEFVSGTGEVMSICHNHPILANKWVRQAINYIIPREHIAKDIMRGMAEPANQLCAPGNWGHNPDLPKPEYSVEKARKYMEKAGYKYEWLQPKPIPLSTYAVPIAGGILLGIGVGVVAGVILTRLKTRRKS
jgi:ABC-type transport system substrate-binding protein